MSQAVAYGSITVVDVTDLGNLSVQPASNMPLTVVYDPDSSGAKFAPVWSAGSPLIVEPIIYYGATRLYGNSTGVTITWQRKEGVNAATNLTTGETVNGGGTTNHPEYKGRLEVTANKFDGNPPTIGSITYIVTVQYTEQTTQTSLYASGQITFSLVQNANKAKSVSITGDTVFKYRASEAKPYSHPAVEPAIPHITLTANLNNVQIVSWEVQAEDGSFVTYPGNPTVNTIDVNYNATYYDSVAQQNKSIFNGRDVALIKVNCTDGLYDLHEIINLYDGAAGSNDVSAVLTNEDQMIPYNGTTDDFSLAFTRIYIYEAGEDVTSTWTITANASNCTREYVTESNVPEHAKIRVTAYATGFTSGSVEFVCEKQGYSNIYKTFTVARVSSGADGHSPTIYSVEPDTFSANRTENGTLSPSSIIFRAFANAWSTSVSPARYVKSAFSGYFKIYVNTDIGSVTSSTEPFYSSSNAESVVSLPYGQTAIPSDAKTLLCVLYQDGAATTRLDYQSVVITDDGTSGSQGPIGPAGTAAVNVTLDNYADVLACDANGRLLADTTITVGFTAYQGTSKIECSLSGSASNYKFPCYLPTDTTTPSGKTPTIVQATSGNSYNGTITWQLPQGALPTSDGGNISLTFSATASPSAVTVAKIYNWSRACAGNNAILLQIFTPSGTNIFTAGVDSLQMQGYLTDGAQPVTSGVSYKWAKWAKQNNVWDYYEFNSDVAGQHTGVNTQTITVYASTVDSYASYRLRATYNSISYYAYYFIFDKTDPIQVTVLSSVGEQLVNGHGIGALFAKVTRNGVVIDEDDAPENSFLADIFYETLPTSGVTNGKLAYQLNTTYKTVTLYEYQSGWQEWATLHSPKTYPWSGTYTWSWRDKDSRAITTYGTNDTPLPTSGKVIYLDGDMVDSKIIADVEVTI